jgi:hypothetical protein
MLFSEEKRVIVQAALKAKREAHSELETAFQTLMDTVEPFDLKDPMMWKTVALLTKKIYHSDNKKNVDGFFCDLYRNKEIHMIHALRMMKTHSQLRIDLYDALDDVATGRGDDGYGDLLDSFFLAGPTVVQAALNKEIGDNTEMSEMVVASLGEKLGKFVLNGENYFRMFMEEEAMRRIDLLKQEERPESEEINLDDSDKPWYEKL